MPDNTCICCGRIIPEGRQICLHCGDYDDQQRFKPDVLPIVRTNGDRIRQMTDEELAALIANENDFCSLCAYKSDMPICTKPLTACTHGFYEWLKQEAKENA